MHRRLPLTSGSFDIETLPDEVVDSLVVDRESLQAAIDDLPEAFKLVVLAFYFEDLSYREIAERLDLPVGTVMSRLSRGKNLLRSRLLESECARGRVSAGTCRPVARLSPSARRCLMDRSEIRDAEIRDAIESCRPGSDDLGLPEMAPLAQALSADAALRASFNRIQRLDRRIVAATRDVPVPAGLAERVLARLQGPSVDRDADCSEQVASTAAMPAITTALARATTVATADDMNSPSSPPPSLARRRFSRRAWSLAAVGACAGCRGVCHSLAAARSAFG